MARTPRFKTNGEHCIKYANAFINGKTSSQQTTAVTLLDASSALPSVKYVPSSIEEVKSAVTGAQVAQKRWYNCLLHQVPRIHACGARSHPATYRWFAFKSGGWDFISRDVGYGTVYCRDECRWCGKCYRLSLLLRRDCSDCFRDLSSYAKQIVCVYLERAFGCNRWHWSLGLICC